MLLQSATYCLCWKFFGIHDLGQSDLWQQVGWELWHMKYIWRRYLVLLVLSVWSFETGITRSLWWYILFSATFYEALVEILSYYSKFCAWSCGKMPQRPQIKRFHGGLLLQTKRRRSRYLIFKKNRCQFSSLVWTNNLEIYNHICDRYRYLEGFYLFIKIFCPQWML